MVYSIERAIRICLNTNYKCHTNHCFFNLDHLLFLPLNIELKSLVFKAFDNLLPQYTCCPTSKKLMTAIIITQINNRAYSQFLRKIQKNF